MDSNQPNTVTPAEVQRLTVGILLNAEAERDQIAEREALRWMVDYGD